MRNRCQDDVPHNITHKRTYRERVRVCCVFTTTLLQQREEILMSIKRGTSAHSTIRAGLCHPTAIVRLKHLILYSRG